MREILSKTAYYDAWDDEYLKKILEHDYEMVKLNMSLRKMDK
jgi:hypothetical protein